MHSPDKIKHALSLVVKGARRQLGWSQEKLAGVADLNKNHVAKIEQRKTSASFYVVCALADALGLSPSAFAGRVEKALKAK